MASRPMRVEFARGALLSTGESRNPFRLFRAALADMWIRTPRCTGHWSALPRNRTISTQANSLATSPNPSAVPDRQAHSEPSGQPWRRLSILVDHVGEPVETDVSEHSKQQAAAAAGEDGTRPGLDSNRRTTRTAELHSGPGHSPAADLPHALGHDGLRRMLLDQFDSGIAEVVVSGPSRSGREKRGGLQNHQRART